VGSGVRAAPVTARIPAEASVVDIRASVRHAGNVTVWTRTGSVVCCIACGMDDVARIDTQSLSAHTHLEDSR